MAIRSPRLSHLGPGDDRIRASHWASLRKRHPDEGQQRTDTRDVWGGRGNPVALLTDFQTTGYSYTYDPYGLPTLTHDSGGNGVGQNPYLFKGGIQDRATGFVKFGGRWYDPATGRWTQQDTLDAPLDPANANRYMFAGDDPIDNGDPSGLDCQVLLIDCTQAAIYALGLAVGPEGAPLAAVIGFYWPEISDTASTYYEDLGQGFCGTASSDLQFPVC